MRFNDCKCGNKNFEIERNGKLKCTACGAWFNPFSAIHHKVIKIVLVIVLVLLLKMIAKYVLEVYQIM